MKRMLSRLVVLCVSHLQGHGSGDKRNIMENIVKVDENYIKDFLSESKYMVT